MKKRGNPGVYIIENTKNGKVYIGASKDTYNRLCMHKTQLRANRHHNSHLQTAFNLYGEEAFKFDVLEECDEQFIYSQENYWCIMLNSHNKEFGYNQDSTGPNGKCGVSNETKLKISMGAEKRPIKAYTLYGEFYKDFSDFYKCGEHFNTSASNIHRKMNILFNKKNLIDSPLTKYIVVDPDTSVEEVKNYWNNIFDQIRSCTGKHAVYDCFDNYIGTINSKKLSLILGVGIHAISCSIRRGTYLKTLKLKRCK